MADRWTKLADLSHKLNTKTLTVSPRRRPYIHLDEAVYDYKVGHEFTVVDQSSPLNGCVVTICDENVLKRNYGISHIAIKYNPSLSPVEVSL